MRHSSEFLRAWSDASGVAIDVGKKLLGYLANQKRLSGVDSLVQRVTLEDGTVVEARWDMNIPTVRIYPGGSEAACELYVESGMLDLGPNIASDAGERFNRGPPEFDDSPATLYFGDGVDCQPNDAGLNGRVRVIGYGMQSDCLPSNGSSVQSRLTDPVKKQAQALLPASCWSGLMQRYVQAVYGGTALDYSASTTTLVVAGASIPATASVGLIAVGGALRFVAFDPVSGALDVRACVPSSPCFSACLGLWRSLSERDDADIARKRKVLSIALSGCKIGKLLETVNTGVSGNAFFPDRPAMHFAADGKSAAVVLESSGVSTAYKINFVADGKRLSVTASAISSGPVLVDHDHWPMYVAGSACEYGSNSPIRHGFDGDGKKIESSSDYDFPVFAVCVGSSNVRVVKYCLIASRRVIARSDGCFDSDVRPTSTGENAPCSSDIKSLISVASGYYADIGGNIEWSSVEKTKVVEHKDNYTATAYGFTSKSLAVVPKGDEYFNSAPASGFTTEVIEVMGSSYTHPAAENDCLYVTGTSPHLVFSITTEFTSPPSDCEFHHTSTFGPCIGPSSGSGIPTYLSEATCDFMYAISKINDFSCMHHERLRDADVYALKVSGNLYLPRAHIISLCSGTYEFVSDRHAISMVSGAYYSVKRDFTDGDGRDECSFSFDFIKITPAPPSTSLCGLDVVTKSDPEGTFSGVYATEFQSYELLRHTKFRDWASPVDLASLSKSMIRGLQSYKSTTSYGGSIYDPREVTIDSDDASESDYIAKGSEELKSACDYVGELFIDRLTNDPISTETSGSNESKEKWLKYIDAPSNPVVTGFNYAGANSLLGAAIFPRITIDRGASINMDRQTITGGYPKVSTPSFVGWA